MKGFLPNLRNRMELQRKGGYIHVPLILWVLIGFTLLVLICLHTYNDILITAKQGYNFWNLLFSGKPQDFYKHAIMTSGNDYYPDKQGAAYLFPVYFTFAIWNFPTWLLSRITGIELFNTIPSMIWMKLLLIPFIILSTKCVFNIVKKIDQKQEYAGVAAFFFMSSVLVIYPTALIGQYDIITTFFILLGFENWLSDKRKGFVAFFAVAILFKYFAFLYFLPLLLLSEKKIRKILLSLVAVALPVLIFLFVFPKPEGQHSNVSRLLYLFLQGIKITDRIQFSVFPFVFIIVLLICYFTKVNERNRIQYATFYLLLIMGSFCTLINPYPYWVVLAAPVFVLICFTSNNMNKIIIFETIISSLIAFKNYAIYHWCFCIRTTGGMGVLHRIFGKSAPKIDAINSVFCYYSRDEVFLSIVFSATIAIFIVMIYFARPNAKQEEILEPFNTITLYGRTVTNIIVALMPTLFLVAYTIIRG